MTSNLKRIRLKKSLRSIKMPSKLAIKDTLTTQTKVSKLIDSNAKQKRR